MRVECEGCGFAMQDLNMILLIAAKMQFGCLFYCNVKSAKAPSYLASLHLLPLR